MLRISPAQSEDVTRRLFRSRVYRFLREQLTPAYRARVGAMDEVLGGWERIAWVDGAAEHDLAVYLCFAWLATFDDEAQRQLRAPEVATRSPETVFAMKSYMVDVGMLDICAFDRG
ncbi:hypothetical protein [Sorangium sp. So ce394]|uniref:hypothetical protein n=1 Tax=Sorangium sp. So ce394 TaxID=3133310 RepID=UPI003F5BB5A5